jgi:hypothetical protein
VHVASFQFDTASHCLHASRSILSATSVPSPHLTIAAMSLSGGLPADFLHIEPSPIDTIDPNDGFSPVSDAANDGFSPGSDAAPATSGDEDPSEMQISLAIEGSRSSGFQNL